MKAREFRKKLLGDDFEASEVIITNLVKKTLPDEQITFLDEQTCAENLEIRKRLETGVGVRLDEELANGNSIFPFGKTQTWSKMGFSKETTYSESVV